MRAWYVPAWNGDWRLESGKDDKTTVLTIERPTSGERLMLKNLSKPFMEKSWIDKSRAEKMKDPSGWRKTVVVLDAPLAEIGPYVASSIRPGQNVITAIRFKDGHIEVAETSRIPSDAAPVSGKHPYRTKEGEEPGKGEEAAPESPKRRQEATEPTEESKALAKKKDAEAAATVKRPTPCCPKCFTDLEECDKPATEVLLAFLSEEEHESWAKYRYVRFKGGMSGHEYLVAHRNSPLAHRNTRIAFDLDDNAVLHFHDWTVPPSEECLAALLLLKFREHWLRNEATTFFATNVRYKNPFGGGGDGVVDSMWTANVGMLLKDVLGLKTPVSVFDPSSPSTLQTLLF